MQLNTQELPKNVRLAFCEVAKLLSYEEDRLGARIYARKKSERGFSVCKQEDGFSIEYSEVSLFCKALSYLGDLKSVGERIEESPPFEVRAMMLDQSRNGVMKTETLKDFTCRAALMGFNRIMLYLEDIYEVAEEPYFGAMRGRYSAAEIAEVESVCERLGIELCPCIQTLAHFNAPFHWWRYAERIVDCDDILLMDREESYIFLEHLIQSISKMFKTRNVHVGMDEAFKMCQGKYRTLYGKCDEKEVFFRHLERVRGICEKYGLHIAVWSDMVYRSATGGTYSQPPLKPIESVEALSKEVALTYWEYGCTKEEEYVRILENHKKIGENEIRFAGTALLHAGIVPNNENAWKTAFPAVNACKRAGVKDVTVTLWGDDGQECSRYAVAPSLVLWSQLLCGGDTEEEMLKRRISVCFEAEWEDFKAIDRIWKTREDVTFHSAHKYLLYNDPLLGLFDSLDGGGIYPTYYQTVSEELREITEKGGKYQEMYACYAALCEALSVKCDLGIRARKAYQTHNKEVLADIIRSLPTVKDKITAYRNAHYAQWRKENKAFGFETIDVRIGAVLRRIDTLGERLQTYLDGKEKSIEELEETPPDFTGRGETETGMSTWKYIPTTGVL